MFTNTVDSIVRDLELKCDKLCALAIKQREVAAFQHKQAATAIELATASEKEAERAERVASKVRALVL